MKTGPEVPPAGLELETTMGFEVENKDRGTNETSFVEPRKIVTRLVFPILTSEFGASPRPMIVTVTGPVPAGAAETADATNGTGLSANLD
jgi:hypothetical protein